MAERFNRTLKTKMWKYFTANNTRRYVDVLPRLLQSYNNTRHSSLKTSPASINETNVKTTFQTLYGSRASSPKYKFRVGDTVRLSKAKKTFDKGYIPNWTEEYFIVTDRFPRTPPVYTIKDTNNEAVEGTFYEKELQKVIMVLGHTYKIERVLDERRGGKEVLVAWKGYPSSFNSWIPASEIQRL